jgi:chemotaxis protein histidine kinase CheA
MTSLHKAFWHSEKDNITLSMPIAKIDKERRIVSGFATLDNVDKQSDVVPFDVSVKAFERFRGNIREMHMPIAVGKMISFKSDKFYNKEDDRFYNGIYVDAYISKGAQDTWEKIIDGTLTGFSIGGNIKNADKAYHEDMDKEIRVIKDYELHELSLVDNPANQFANIISIQKAENGENTMTGLVTKAAVENVFWSKQDGTIRLSKEDDARGDEVSIGFIESNEEDKASVIKGLLKSQENKLGEELAKNENLEKEGINMARKKTQEVVEETTVEKAAETEEVIVDEIVKSDDAPAEAPAEEAAAEASEEETTEAPAEEAEESVEKSDEPVKEEVVEKSEDIADAAATPAEESVEADLAKAVDTVKTSVEDLSKSVVEAVSNLTETISALKIKLQKLQKTLLQ